MVAVLQVAPEERPALMFDLERLIPMLRRGAKEDQDTAEHLAYILRGLEQAPPGAGEIELLTQDIFALGIHNFAASVDLEEYWLDLRQTAAGRAAADTHELEVTVPAARHFPEMVAAPQDWNFLGVEGQFSDLGFKLDRLLTAEAPRSRGVYNKARNPITAGAIERRRQNAIRRNPNSQLAARHPDMVQIPATVGAGYQASPGATVDHGTDAHEEAPRPRPVGTALAPAGVAAAGLSVVSRATYPGSYDWGVETATGMNADDLEPDHPARLNIGGAELMLVNTEGKVCAASRICPHRGWDLARGTVANGVVTCSLHGAQFNLSSGEVVREPFDAAFNSEHSVLGGLMAVLDPKHSTGPIASYPTHVADDGEVSIHI